MINKNNNIHAYNIYFLIYAADFQLINKSFFFIYYISHAAHSNNHTCRYNLDEIMRCLGALFSCEKAKEKREFHHKNYMIYEVKLK